MGGGTARHSPCPKGAASVLREARPANLQGSVGSRPQRQRGGTHRARWGEKGGLWGKDGGQGTGGGFRRGGGVWEGDPRGTLTQAPAQCTAGSQRELEKGVSRKREKEEQERKTTPELPDQVIAVRCQSAAERGVGRERRDMRRIRAVCDRERTSVRNRTASCCLGLVWGPCLALNPPPDQPHFPTAATIPAAAPTGRRSPAQHT